MEVFYKSESDHSDDGGENMSTVDENDNNPTHEPQNQEHLPENSFVPVNSAATPLGNNDLATELENDLEIQDKPESTTIVPLNVNSCDQNSSSHTTGMIESSVMDLEMPNEESEEFCDQPMNVENCVTGNEEVSAATNTDLADPEESNMTESKSSPPPQEVNLAETSGAVEENLDVNSLSESPVKESAPQPKSADIGEAMLKNLQHSAKESETEENSSVSSGPKEPVPKDTDDFDLMIQDSSTSKQSVQNDTEPADTDDFDLMIEDSCNDTEENKNDSETITPEPATDLRSKKLALFSRLKIPLRTDIKLQASPDMVIELETPTITESEFGVYELKKKFAFHSSMRNKPIRKTSTKLRCVMSLRTF